MVIHFNNSALSVKSSAQKFVQFALLMLMMEMLILITFVTVLLGEHALNNIAMITIHLLQVQCSPLCAKSVKCDQYNFS